MRKRAKGRERIIEKYVFQRDSEIKKGRKRDQLRE